MIAFLAAAASDDASKVFFEDLSYAGIALLITVVLCAVLLWVRSRVSGSGWRDFLGITTAFVVLGFATFAMIIGEKLLG